MSILTGLSLGLRLSVRPFLPAAAAVALMAYAVTPALPGIPLPGLPQATLCVALLDIATLLGLAWRLRAEDRRHA